MLTHYILVRRDLPLGVVAAMVTHAAGESSPLYMGDGKDPDTRFRGCRAVVLGVKDEVELLRAQRKLFRNDIQHVVVVENAPPYDGQSMSIGLVPVESDKVNQVMKEFQTLKTLIDIPSESS